MAKKENGKNGEGRPSKYKEEYCQALIDFFCVEPTKEVTTTFTNKKGDTWEKDVTVANPLPFFQDFARTIKVTHATLINWTEKHPEFLEAYKVAKDMQESFLVQNALLGYYNATFSIFTAKNILGWRDVHEHDHTLSTKEAEGRIRELEDANIPEATLRHLAAGNKVVDIKEGQTVKKKKGAK